MKSFVTVVREIKFGLGFKNIWIMKICRSLHGRHKNKTTKHIDDMQTTYQPHITTEIQLGQMVIENLGGGAATVTKDFFSFVFSVNVVFKKSKMVQIHIVVVM